MKRRFEPAGIALMASMILGLALLQARAQDDTVTVSGGEFQRLAYSAHLLTQLDEKPELDASLQVLLELQRRNPHADPAALADLARQALERYRANAPDYLQTLGHRDEILAAYLEALNQLPARSDFVSANLSLLHTMITRAPAPDDEPQADLIHSGSRSLLEAQGELSQRYALLDACTKRARSHPAFGAAMDNLLLPEVLVSLDDTAVEIIGNTNSALHSNPTLQALLAMSETSGDGSLTVSSNQLLNLFTNETQTLWDTINTNLALRLEVNQSQPDWLAYLTNQAAIDANVAREAAVKRGQTRKIASATAAILVQSKLMEARNPAIKLPSEMGVVGGAMASIAKGVSLMSSRDAGKFTKIMASGNFITAGLQVFGLLSGAESPEDTMVREIGNIKRLIQDLNANMNYRFDRVDQSLTQIFDTLNERFDQIEITLDAQGRQIAHLNGDVDQIRLSLLDVQTELYRIERNLATFHALDWRYDLLEDMDLAGGYEARVGNPMQYQDFTPSYVGLENVFHNYAYSRAVSETLSHNTTLPFGDQYFYYQLSPGQATNVYAETLNYLKRCLRERLLLTGFAEQPMLANPQDWNVGASALLQLASENPNYFRKYERTVGYPSRLDDIISRGQDLTNFFRNLTFMGSGTNINWPVYDALVGNYSVKLTNLISEAQAAEQQYASDNHFDLATFRQWDPPMPRFAGTATAVLESHFESPVVPPEFILAGAPASNGIIALGGDTSGSHGLALQSGGTVTAWGENDDGQSNVPAGLSNVIAVAAGSRHSLALKADGTIAGWGLNRFGQANAVGMATNVVALAAGTYHSLALRADGTVVGWGYNQHGEATGVATTGSPYASTGLVTVAEQTLTNAVAIGAGFYYSLALKHDGTVVAWGNNEYDEITVPPGVSNLVAIAAGGFHSLGLHADGTVIAWGNNDYGQTNVPSNLSNVVAVAAGSHHSLALRENGTVVAWGYGGSGQTNVPSGLSNVVAIAADQMNSLALCSDGTLVAWGWNDWLWEGPVPVPRGLSNVVDIAAGSQHCLALSADGTVTAWGGNQYGESDVPEGLSNVVAIAAGNYHSLALRADGTVAAWGTGYWDYGQTNVPTGLSNVVSIAAGDEYSVALKNDGHIVPWGRTLQNAPANLSNIVAIAAARYHCLALTIDRRVRAWGENYWGQCNVPASATNVVALAAGSLHNLALRADGTVVAWGNNTAGECNVPEGLSNVVAIASGSSHSVAVKNDGSVVTWGYNGQGQCNVPANASNVVGVAADYQYTLYLDDRSPSGSGGAHPLTFVRPTLPSFLFGTLKGVDEHVLTNLSFDLHDPAIELSGAKALLQAVVELGLPYTLERDDVLHGFFYGNDALVDLDIAHDLLASEIERLDTNPAATPMRLREVAPLRLECFTERLEARLNDLAATGQPEIPRLVAHTLRLLSLLRDSWSSVPPAAVEISREPAALNIELYGEPYAHYWLQESFRLANWSNTTITNLRSRDTPIGTVETTVPVTGAPEHFYRAVESLP